ncbi:MAG: hypothetical protein JWO57_1109, partial [Pseudonocardiales bacterium]|nr:hypothetical protein [Pseudonocardiales bacterium]
TTDAKTGLLNAVAWEQLSQRELSRAERQGDTTAVLIIDLDRFKLINDDYGHLVGDIALKAVSQCLKNELRGYDMVGRFGGEEFVALLPSVGEENALLIAQRLRRSLELIRVASLVAPTVEVSPDRSLTVSIGVACSPIDGTEIGDLLHAADSALYVAKQSGRNRVELARRGPTQPGVSIAL